MALTLYVVNKNNLIAARNKNYTSRFYKAYKRYIITTVFLTPEPGITYIVSVDVFCSMCIWQLC
jgi:hypothetical protein